MGKRRLRDGKGPWDVGPVMDLVKVEGDWLLQGLDQILDLISVMLQALLVSILRIISLILRNTVSLYNILK